MINKLNSYRVRKQSSGYTFSETWIVVRNPGGHRVTVHPHRTRESAQGEADRLNIGAMVKDYADDPRPYDERYAEAETTYRASIKAGRPLIDVVDD